MNKILFLYFWEKINKRLYELSIGDYNFLSYCTLYGIVKDLSKWGLLRYISINMFINSCDKSGLAIVKIHLHESMSSLRIIEFYDFCEKKKSFCIWRIFTFANGFPYMTLSTKLTFNFAWIHLITWYYFFFNALNTISSLQYIWVIALLSHSLPM